LEIFKGVFMSENIGARMRVPETTNKVCSNCGNLVRRVVNHARSQTDSPGTFVGDASHDPNSHQKISYFCSFSSCGKEFTVTEFEALPPIKLAW
jgi:hypothetical protein